VDHVRTRGAGHGEWLENGDGNIWPLCRIGHVERHTCGLLYILHKYGVDAGEVAKTMGEAYLRKCRYDNGFDRRADV
jgi:hypothetical protein